MDPPVDEQSVGAHTDAVQVSLLGAWQLTCAGRDVPQPGNVQRLIALLSLKGAQSRSSIAETLWPTSSERRARANLRATVSRLRRVQPPVVRVSLSTLRLHEDVSVDAHNLTRHASLVLGGSAGTEHLPMLLTTGDLLPGWYDDWVVTERERLQQLRLHALETLADRLARRGRLALALDAALAAVQIDPLRETAQRTAIRIHIAEGNTVDAIRRYEDFRALLDRELGVAPSRLLVELIRPFVHKP